ncbi:MAG: hypothetical protein RLZ60_278 [Pseudomonadota bacterium]|jgi:hypothetical protein
MSLVMKARQRRRAALLARYRKLIASRPVVLRGVTAI